MKDKAPTDTTRPLKAGRSDPDFLAAVGDLRASSCLRFNEGTPDKPEVYYQVPDPG